MNKKIIALDSREEIEHILWNTLKEYDFEGDEAYSIVRQYAYWFTGNDAMTEKQYKYWKFRFIQELEDNIHPDTADFVKENIHARFMEVAA